MAAIFYIQLDAALSESCTLLLQPQGMVVTLVPHRADAGSATISVQLSNLPSFQRSDLDRRMS